MEKLQRLRGTPKCLLWERRSGLLAGEARIAELVHLGEQGHATDQLLARHLPERGEVAVAESGMPGPRRIIGARGQADWACNVDVEHVRPAWAPRDLGEQAAFLIPDPHQAILHEHLVAAFVELADGDDVGGEARQEVDVGERLVLPVLAGEEDGAAALDLRYGAVAEPDGPVDAVSISLMCSQLEDTLW